MEKSKNNNKKRKVGDVERTVDGEENMGTKRRGGGAMFERMDAYERRGRVVVLIEYEGKRKICARKRKKSNYNDGNNHDARYL